MKLLFSFKGRISRKEYWIGLTISSFLLFPPIFAIAYELYLKLTAEMTAAGDMNFITPLQNTTVS